MIRIFLKDALSQYPVVVGIESFQQDTNWQEDIIFYNTFMEITELESDEGCESGARKLKQNSRHYLQRDS